MPVQGFDDASKNINKKRKERKRGFPGAQKAKSAIGDFVESAGDVLIYQRRQAKARAEAAKTAKQAKPAKTNKKELDYFAGESDKAVKRDADKKAAKTTKIEDSKTSNSKVTGAIGSEARKKQYDALNWKYDDTIKVKPKVETKDESKLVNAPGAYTKPSEFKKSVSTFTSAADSIKAKGVGSLKSTASKDSAAPKKPRTSSDKAANRKYQKEMSAYNRKNQTLTKRKQGKRETEAMVTRAKGISATTLGDYETANKLVRKEGKIKGKIAKTNKKMSGAVEEKTKKGTYDFKKGIKVSMFNR